MSSRDHLVASQDGELTDEPIVASQDGELTDDHTLSDDLFISKKKSHKEGEFSYRRSSFVESEEFSALFEISDIETPTSVIKFCKGLVKKAYDCYDLHIEQNTLYKKYTINARIPKKKDGVEDNYIQNEITMIGRINHLISIQKSIKDVASYSEYI